ncbi:MAG: hypothetical protein HN509_05545, partial [Halobacteriovoraceae bacterium]|nr:hypothetical protein [Halobacteriovoraceae bacterium]
GGQLPAFGCDGGVITATDEPFDCGGAIGDCVGGGGAQIGIWSGSPLARSQPQTQATTVVNGTNVTYDYGAPSPLGKIVTQNRFLANYSAVPQCLKGTNEYIFDITEWENHTASVGSASGTPYGTEGIINPLIGLNATYNYRCTDGAGNTKARVRLMVRDWDRPFRISDNIDKVNPPLMDDAGNDLFALPWNGVGDWDDDPSDLNVTPEFLVAPIIGVGCALPMAQEYEFMNTFPNGN